ncbi:MAG: F0F1 ATP synthase subunit A [Actinobacteria bacterium]|nr:F0F1 ATP synthase subunit A [Actinomycetota bacterium]
MDALSGLNEEISHLLNELASGKLAGTDAFYVSQYTFWMVIAAALMLIVVFAAKKRLAIVPEGRFVNGVEALVEFVRKDVGEGVVGHGAEKHLPFLLTVFFFIVINNLLGLIPGVKPGTGTMGVTVALALIVFVYFNYYGIKKQGVGHYIINIAPKGIMFPLNILIWCIELISLLLRVVTLSVRLFANMYAGHIVLGTFALLTTLFITPAIQQLSGAAVAGALPAIAWMLLLVIMYAMELLVAVIQAYVFTLLTAVYISLATSEH